MDSSNHSVRYCSSLNLHIIITQMELPNQSKHMDMILRELWEYYAGALAHSRTHTHIHTHTHTYTHTHTHTHTHAHFPKVKQMPNTIFPARDNQSLMRQVIPPGQRPLSTSLWLLLVHASAQLRRTHTHAHTHTQSHLSVIQKYASSTIWGSQAASYCVKIACCKRICEHRQWRQRRLFQEICETIGVRSVLFSV